MPNERVCANAPGLPAGRLYEIHDCLCLALDGTERRGGYSQSEREARSYVRAALRQTRKLMEGAPCQ
ncbi:hypothetical protein [Palleronia caenipelagi]|uniref:Uncharacterized protein n=1 Tax=Palleronia caenipelagi TaxID=2489174 RepID=A0A547Q6S4_9RHOB|nr:hypothetical protein [Palleronia caenipelagi]TRD22090.1 hypothetical protein FEV53_06925 [Palleronia caenipelagi]